jgi:hypothetical protein
MTKRLNNKINSDIKDEQQRGEKLMNACPADIIKKNKQCLQGYHKRIFASELQQINMKMKHPEQRRDHIKHYLKSYKSRTIYTNHRKYDKN